MLHSGRWLLYCVFDPTYLSVVGGPCPLCGRLLPTYLPTYLPHHAGDLFLNKRDYPQLKADLSEPYDYLFDEDEPTLSRERYETYAPILRRVTRPPARLPACLLGCLPAWLPAFRPAGT
jgi:hypothetical protein